ncbi:MAG TPA: SpoIIE family protein phosphatase [Candidatus Cybelea sp.]|jgi:serine phosphatase RsbU (regulator of sigma subunit)/anti-sigma regulatory factor (Ser/Thr protein kinase)|nr:SpoIIE family protein phosphatase [Candidatus Cybelea sp.]
MKKLDEQDLALIPAERALHSVRAVMARTCDAVWQADADGTVTNITLSRPHAPCGEGALDESEVRRIERLWRRCVRCADRFRATFRVYASAAAARTFTIEAMPLLDGNDSVVNWSGSVAEADPLAESGNHFVSEAAAVLSSSLNRTTIVNRLLETSVEHFGDRCAFHAFDDYGTMSLEAVANRQALRGGPELERAIEETIRNRAPLLFQSVPLQDPSREWMNDVLTAVDARSMIVAPLFVGTSCIGALSFLESERASRFAAHDVETAVIVARQLAMALENIKTFQRERQITQRFRFLARVTERLFDTLDPTQTLQLVVDSLTGGFADYAVAARLTDNALSILASAGTTSGFREKAQRKLVASLRQRRGVLVADETRPGPLHEEAPPRSWMAVPLFAESAVFGAIVCCANAHAYDESELELLEEIGRRTSLSLEHAESFARERRLVQTLQQATLPTRLARIEGASLSAIYRPASVEMQVGGDWYDAFDIDEHRVLLTVGDVTGHGLEASIVMGKLRHAINVVAMYEPDPVRILDAAEHILLRRFPGSVATAFIAILDSRRGTITYANAGHPYPVLRRGDGSLKELEADGLPIGLRSLRPNVTSVTERLDDASLIALYTDGLTEATHDMVAGEALLHGALGSDAIFYVESPAEFVEKFCVRERSRDDLAVLVLNFVKSQRWTFDSASWRAARLARREFAQYLADAGAPENEVRAAELIFGELAANVAQHVGGTIEAALDWHGAKAVLHVTDRGEGYATTECEAADLLTEHGRGLWIVQRLGAKISLEILPGFGTHVRAELPVMRTSAL